MASFCQHVFESYYLESIFAAPVQSQASPPETYVEIITRSGVYVEPNQEMRKKETQCHADQESVQEKGIT